MKKFAFIIGLGLAACAGGQDGLSEIHADIVSDYPAVKHVSATELKTTHTDDLVILDIREPEEFAVSHLSGAMQIDMDISEEALIAQLENLSGKDVVVYCSVGRRSSIFAERMTELLMTQGANSVSNLENGIFGWHNEERDLVDAEGKTDVVHPYDEIWKRYVEQKDKAAYTPQ